MKSDNILYVCYCLASHFLPPSASGVHRGRELTIESVSSLLAAHIFRREGRGCLSVHPSHLQSVHQPLGVALIVLWWGGGEKQRKNVGTQSWKTGSAKTKHFQKPVRWEALTRHGRGYAVICLCLSKGVLRCQRAAGICRSSPLGEDPSALNTGCYKWLDCRWTLAMDTTARINSNCLVSDRTWDTVGYPDLGSLKLMGTGILPLNNLYGMENKEWSPFRREVVGALQHAQKKMDLFYCSQHKHSFESFLYIHSMAKLQVKQVLNQIHDFSHTTMRKGTVILEKATPSAPVDVKGWFTPPLTLTWPQQEHWRCISSIWPLFGSFLVMDIISSNYLTIYQNNYSKKDKNRSHSVFKKKRLCCWLL